jgi:hypothetical protein
VRHERGRADDGDAVSRRRDLPVGAREQVDELVGQCGDVAAQAQPALDVAAEPIGPQLGIRGRRQQALPALGPKARWSRSAVRRAGHQRANRGRPPGKRDRAGQHGLAGRVLELEHAAVTGRCRQPGAQCVELIMQTLLKHAARVDELAAVTDRPEQPLDHRRRRPAAGAAWRSLSAV